MQPCQRWSENGVPWLLLGAEEFRSILDPSQTAQKPTVGQIVCGNDTKRHQDFKVFLLLEFYFHPRISDMFALALSRKNVSVDV